jgi:hypothetical protein
MQADSGNYTPKSRVRKWIKKGLLFLPLFAICLVIIEINRVTTPVTQPLVDSFNRKYYEHIVPVSEQDRTYLIVVSYDKGFEDPYSVSKIYYVWYKNSFGEPLRAVIYNELGDISGVHFYREGAGPNSSITSDLLNGTWVFTPPKVFPYELLESEAERAGWRVYNGWQPPSDF